MSELVVRIDVGDLIDPERGDDLTQLIVKAAAEQILEDWKPEALSQVRAHARTIFEAELTTLIKGMLAESVEQAIQGTDSWGNPKGPETTLHEVIVKRSEAALRQRRERSDYRPNQRPLIEEILEAEIGKAWAKELGQVIDQARHDARDAVAAKAGEVISEAIMRTVPK